MSHKIFRKIKSFFETKIVNEISGYHCWYCRQNLRCETFTLVSCEICSRKVFVPDIYFTLLKESTGYSKEQLISTYQCKKCDAKASGISSRNSYYKHSYCNHHYLK